MCHCLYLIVLFAKYRMHRCTQELDKLKNISIYARVVHATEASVLKILWSRFWGKSQWYVLRSEFPGEADVLFKRDKCTHRYNKTRKKVQKWLEVWFKIWNHLKISSEWEPDHTYRKHFRHMERSKLTQWEKAFNSLTYLIYLMVFEGDEYMYISCSYRFCANERQS